MTSGGRTNPFAELSLGYWFFLTSIPLAILSFVVGFSAAIEEPFMGGVRSPRASYWYLGVASIVILLWLEWSVALVYFVIRKRLCAWWCFALLWAIFNADGGHYAIWEYAGDNRRWDARLRESRLEKQAEETPRPEPIPWAWPSREPYPESTP